jgi:hypothetical protein
MMVAGAAIRIPGEWRISCGARREGGSERASEVARASRDKRTSATTPHGAWLAGSCSGWLAGGLLVLAGCSLTLEQEGVDGEAILLRDEHLRSVWTRTSGATHTRMGRAHERTDESNQAMRWAGGGRALTGENLTGEIEHAHALELETSFDAIANSGSQT